MPGCGVMPTFLREVIFMKKVSKKLNQTFFAKIGLIGLLLLSLLIGVVPAKAAQVIAGAVPDSRLFNRSKIPLFCQYA